MEYYSSLDARELDAETPTLFEIISSNELEQLLSPSLRFILVYYAQRYPRYLLQITNRFDELNLLVRSLIEYTHLKNWNSSFTEKFYGLKRVHHTPIILQKTSLINQSMIEERRRLTKIQVLVSLFEITGTSYLYEKLNYEYEKLYAKVSLNQLRPTSMKNKLKILFTKIYPGINALFKVLNVLLQVLYLSGRIRSPSIITYLFNIRYARMNNYDYDLSEKRNTTKDTSRKITRIRPPSNGEQALRIINSISSPLKKLLTGATGTAFPIAIFLLKFLEWWNSSEFASTLLKKQRNALEINVIPPSNATTEPRYKSTDKCPLCKQQINNPSIIETGYVFCYTCIQNYLKRQDGKGGRCPISGRRLLGCRYNSTEEVWEIEGIRRLML